MSIDENEEFAELSKMPLPHPDLARPATLDERWDNREEFKLALQCELIALGNPNQEVKKSSPGEDKYHSKWDKIYRREQVATLLHTVLDKYDLSGVIFLSNALAQLPIEFNKIKEHPLSRYSKPPSDAEIWKQAITQSLDTVGSSRVDLQACKLEYSIVSPK